MTARGERSNETPYVSFSVWWRKRVGVMSLNSQKSPGNVMRFFRSLETVLGAHLPAAAITSGIALCRWHVYV